MLWEYQRETADVVVNPLSLRGKHHHGWVKENKLPKKREIHDDLISVQIYQKTIEV